MTPEAQILLLVKKMMSQEAFEQVSAYVTRETDRAANNGGVLAFEHFLLKHLKKGVLDHHYHQGDERCPLPYDTDSEDELCLKIDELCWGLACATLMLLLAKARGQTQGLVPYLADDEGRVDQDVRLATEYMLIPGLLEILHRLDQDMADFLPEEYAIYPADHHRTAYDLETDMFCPYWTHLLTHDSMPPIVVIQYQAQKLPYEDGQWNDMNRSLVKQTLIEAGQADYLQTGVITLVIHGDKIGDNLIVDHRSLYQPWQTVSGRVVLGVLAENNLVWHEQYDQLEKTIDAYVRTALLVIGRFCPSVCRNLLVAAQDPQVDYQQSVSGAAEFENDSEPRRREIARQLAINDLLGDIFETGYQWHDGGRPLLANDLLIQDNYAALINPHLHLNFEKQEAVLDGWRVLIQVKENLIQAAENVDEINQQSRAIGVLRACVDRLEQAQEERIRHEFEQRNAKKKMFMLKELKKMGQNMLTEVKNSGISKDQRRAILQSKKSRMDRIAATLQTEPVAV